MANPTYYFKPRWQDHLNSTWTSERIDTIATREGAQLLCDSLLANKVTTVNNIHIHVVFFLVEEGSVI